MWVIVHPSVVALPQPASTRSDVASGAANGPQGSIHRCLHTDATYPLQAWVSTLPDLDNHPVRGSEVTICLPSLPHHAGRATHAGRAIHAGRAVRRLAPTSVVATTRHFCVIRRQGLRSWSRDLTNTAVRRVVRRCVCVRVRHSGSGQTLSVGVGLRRGSGVGLRGRRHDAADLKNLTRGITSSQRRTGCLRTAGGQCNAEHAGGPDRDQLGGYLHHVFALHPNAPVLVRCNDCLSAL
jgi:hypothetical protein